MLKKPDHLRSFNDVFRRQIIERSIFEALRPFRKTQCGYALWIFDRYRLCPLPDEDCVVGRIVYAGALFNAQQQEIPRKMTVRLQKLVLQFRWRIQFEEALQDTIH